MNLETAIAPSTTLAGGSQLKPIPPSVQTQTQKAGEEISELRTRLRKATISSAATPISMDQLSEATKQKIKFVFTWLNKVKASGEYLSTYQIQEDMLFDQLRDGEILCRLLSMVETNGKFHANETKTPYAAVENLNNFITGIRRIPNVNSKHLFRTAEVVSPSPKGNDDLLRCLVHVSIIAHEQGIKVEGYSVDEAKKLLSSWEEVKETSYVVSSIATPGSRDPSGAFNFREGRLRTKSNAVNPLPEDRRENDAFLKVGNDGNVNSSHLTTLLLDISSKFDRMEIGQKNTTMRVDRLQDGLLSTFDLIVKRLLELEYQNREILSELASFRQDARKFTNTNSTAQRNSVGSIYQSTDTTLIFHDAATESSSSAPKANTGSTPNIAVHPTVAFHVPMKEYGKLPAEVESMELTPQEKKRQSAIYEFLETEEDHIKDMQLLLTMYVSELRDSKLIREDDIRKVFANLEELIATNQKLHEKLSERQKTNAFFEQVGDILVEMADSFKTYTTYCANYHPALKYFSKLCAREDVKTFISKFKLRPESRGLTIEAFMIKPVQRICKYPLLIREILKHTDKTTKDADQLQVAFEKMEKIVTLVNEETRAAENREKVSNLIQKLDTSLQIDLSTKKLLLDGHLQKFGMGGLRERYVVLFEDVLVVFKTALMNKGKYQLEAFLQLHDVALTDKTLLKTQFQISIAHEKRDNYIFQCSKEEEKNRWIETLSDTIQKIVTRRRASRSSESSSLETNDTAHKFGTQSHRKAAKLTKPKSGSLKSKNSTSLSTTEEDTKKPSKNASSRKHAAVINAKDEDTEILDNIANLEEELPESIEINNQTWKRTESAFGQTYWYNPMTRETRWIIPEEMIHQTLLGNSHLEKIAEHGNAGEIEISSLLDKSKTLSDSMDMSSSKTSEHLHSQEHTQRVEQKQQSAIVVNTPNATEPLSTKHEEKTTKSAQNRQEDAARASVAPTKANVSETTNEESILQSYETNDVPAYPILTDVEGFPDWRRVEKEAGLIYYFNINTSETSWTPPEKPKT